MDDLFPFIAGLVFGLLVGYLVADYHARQVRMQLVQELIHTR